MNYTDYEVRDLFKRFGSRDHKEFLKSRSSKNHLNNKLNYLVFDDGNTRFNPNYFEQLQESFLKYEDLLTDDYMFWIFLPWFWCRQSSTNGWDKVFEKFGRMKIPLKERSEVGMKLSDCDTPQSNRVFRRTILNNESKSVTLYRGFNANINKKIRSFDNNYLQEEGHGFSYSVNEFIAIKMANSSLSPRYYTKYADFKLDELKDTRIGGNFDYWESWFLNDYISCIGKYDVLKEDILFYTNISCELEVVVNPKKAKLVRYDFLKPNEYFARWYMIEKINRSNANLSNITNINEIYKFFCKEITQLSRDKIISMKNELKKMSNLEETSISGLFARYKIHEVGKNQYEFSI